MKYTFVPIGLKPKWLVDLERLREIQGAIARYYDVEKAIPVEWIEEYNYLIKATDAKRRNIARNEDETVCMNCELKLKRKDCNDADFEECQKLFKEREKLLDKQVVEKFLKPLDTGHKQNI